MCQSGLIWPESWKVCDCGSTDASPVTALSVLGQSSCCSGLKMSNLICEYGLGAQYPYYQTRKDVANQALVWKYKHSRDRVGRVELRTEEADRDMRKNTAQNTASVRCTFRYCLAAIVVHKRRYKRRILRRCVPNCFKTREGLTVAVRIMLA